LREATGIKSMKDRRKELRQKLFFKCIENNLMNQGYVAPQPPINSRQHSKFFLPAISSKVYFHSFYPRTTRELRDGI